MERRKFTREFKLEPVRARNPMSAFALFLEAAVGCRDFVTLHLRASLKPCPIRNSTNSMAKRTPNAETQVHVLEAGRVPAAAGRAETLGNIFPGPAADDTVGATAACSPRRAVRRRSIVIIVIAILDPLRDIAVHIVEPKLIRCELSDLGGQRAAAVTAGVARANLVAP
jgi:hypothetical protein